MPDTQVTVKKLVESLSHIEVISGAQFLDNQITVSDLTRPGLELAGYFRFYPSERVQLFGQTEITFFEDMTSGRRRTILERLCREQPPVFLIARDLTIQDEFFEVTEKYGVPILRSNRSTTRLSAIVMTFLEEHLAERFSQHGVMLDINGMGVLIIGESGIGKSETALELIQRGHRLIADDRVDLYMVDESRIIAESPEILRHLIEIRGIGIINVMNLFGVGSIRPSKVVDVVIELNHWDPAKKYDRLGSNIETHRIFNVDIPKLSIPVKVGRNLAIIIEIATMNIRSKQLGYDATEEFQRNLTDLIQKNSENYRKQQELE